MLTEKERYVVLKILADGKSHGLRELCSAIQRKVSPLDIGQATFVRWIFGKDDFMFQVDGALHQQEIISKVKEYENNGLVEIPTRRKRSVNMDNIKLVCRVLSQLRLDVNMVLDADGTGELYVYDGATWLGTISFVDGELVDWA